MPLLHKKKFVRKRPPRDLNPMEEVFFCSATHEIFRNYEEFFERTILVNSLVWSCEVCGKGELTYEEAQECEARAQKALMVFSDGMMRGILCLINLTYRSSFLFLVDDVFQFIKERYFVDELVDFTPPGQKKSRPGRVLRITHPTDSRMQNGDCESQSPKLVNGSISGTNNSTIDLTESDDEIQIVQEEKSPSQAMPVSSKSSGATSQVSGSSKNSPKFKELKVPAPTSLMYLIRDDTNGSKTFYVAASNVVRQKGVLSKDRIRNFLRIVTEVQPNIGYYRVNPKVARRKFGIGNFGNITWDRVFGGPLPKFIKAPLSSVQQSRLAAAANQSQLSSKEKQKGRKSKGEKEKKGRKPNNANNVDDKKKKKKKREKDTQLHSPSDEKTLQQIAAEAEAARRKEKAEEMQREWRRLEEEMKRRESEKQARLAERERHREEKRLRELLVKEWSKTRDDLACDDLRVLPDPTPVESKLPAKHFGEALAVIEFFSAFSDVFRLRSDLKGFSNSSRGPPGTPVSFYMLEKALLSKDPNGPLADLFFSILTALQKLQQREDRDEQVADEDDGPDDMANTEGGPTKVYSQRLHDAVRAASHCARLSVNRFGETLSQVHLDSMTLTEVIRLHLLSSGARVSSGVALFRWRCRGGMTHLDDPGLHFARSESEGSELVTRLERTNVFDLPPGDKLSLLRVLMDQLLTFASARQSIDGCGERLKSLRAEFRSLTLSVQRAERNLAALRFKRKQAKKNQIEQAIAAAAMNAANGTGAAGTAEKDTDEKEKENKKERPSKPSSPMSKPMTRKDKKDTAATLTKKPTDVDPNEITDDVLEKAQNALEEMKASVAEKEVELMEKLINALAGFSGPVALGRDRAYRRYWLSRGLSGLLVESPGIDYEDERRALLVEAKVCRQMSSEDERFSLQRHTRTPDSGMKFVTSWDCKEQIAAGDPIHSQWQKLVQESCCGEQQWFFIPDMIALDDLSESLNQRGFRESALKASLTEYRSVLEEAIDYCPVDDLIKGATEAAKFESKMEEKEKENAVNQQADENGLSDQAVKQENDDEGDVERKTKVVTFGVKSRGGLVAGRAGSDSASEWMELNLREALLDLEERIYAGALGSIKVTDRGRWREILEKGGYESLVSKPLEENGDKAEEEPTDIKEEKIELEIDEDSNETVAAKQDEIAERVVRDLSSALLQIANGLLPRFIVAPLGDHDEATKEAQRKSKIQAKLRKQKERERREKLKASRNRTRGKQEIEEDLYASSSSSDEGEEDSGLSTFERWQQGLQQATSLSQIALYLSALDRSISWSKSLLKARCKICRRKGDDSLLLLCDGCDRGFHMYCLQPRLTKVPVGDWFCPGCRPPEPEPEPSRRSKKKAFVKMEEEEEEEAEEDEEDEDDDTDGGDGSDESTEGEESEEETADSSSAEVDEENEDEEEEEEEEEDEEEEEEEDDDDDEENEEEDENHDSSRRRSGRIRKQTSKASAAKVRLPLATPSRASRTQRRSGSSRLSGRGHSSYVEDSPLTASGGTRGRLKRGHPDGEALRDIECLVNELIRHEDAWPFLHPVRKNEVPDYYDIIKYPMDLGTMRVNFNRLVYDAPQQPMIDLWRIFSNCEIYNQADSEEYQCATKLRRFTEKRVRELSLTKYSDKALEVVSGSASDSTPQPPSKKRTRTN